MQPFNLTLPNNTTVTGIHSLPQSLTSPSLRHRPLIVALHGGTYTSHYFNGTKEHSASIPSLAYGIPFVAIDRPGYGGTSSFLPVPADSDFNRETGLRLHRVVLPALWTEYGQGCTCLVLLCHSLGGMGGIVASALHALDQNPAHPYPLRGISLSGLGDKPPSSSRNIPAPEYEKTGPHHSLVNVDTKDKIMFRHSTCTPEVLAQSEALNAPIPDAELAHFIDPWLRTWKEEWACHVKVPVMFALVERDPFFEASREEVRGCMEAFRESVRVDGSLIKGLRILWN